MLDSRFCQGSTQQGLKFETFYGDEWKASVENKFREWAVRVFGGVFRLLRNTRLSDLARQRRGRIDGICSFSQRTWLLRPRLRRKTRLLRLLRRKTHPLWFHLKAPPLGLLRLRNPRPDHRDLGNQHLNCLCLRNQCPSRSLLILHRLRQTPPFKPRSHLIYLKVPQLPSLVFQCHTLRPIHPQTCKTLTQIWHCSPRRSAYTNRRLKQGPFHKSFEGHLRSPPRPLTSSSHPNLP